MKKWMKQFGGKGFACLWGMLVFAVADAGADPKKSTAIQVTANCKAIVAKIAQGFDKEGDEFYETAAFAVDAVRARDVFWWRDLAAVEALALLGLERRGEPMQANELPLSQVRNETLKFRLENLPHYLEKLANGTFEEKILAVNSLFLASLNEDVADKAIEGIEKALIDFHPEVQRYAFKGLWSLWVVYDAMAVKHPDAHWAERRERIENLFSVGLEARIKVLKFDLENNRLISPDARVRMLEILKTRTKLISQVEAEAFYEAVSDFLKLNDQDRPITRLNFESNIVITSVGETNVILDFQTRNDPLEVPIPGFSPEVVQLLQSVDPSINEKARLYATYLMEYARDQVRPKFAELISLYRIKLQQLERRTKEREASEKEREVKRVAELRSTRRDELVKLVLEATTPEKEEAVLSRIRNFIETYQLSFESLKSRDDDKGVTLDVLASRVGLPSLAKAIASEWRR